MHHGRRTRLSERVRSTRSTKSGRSVPRIAKTRHEDSPPHARPNDSLFPVLLLLQSQDDHAAARDSTNRGGSSLLDFLSHRRRSAASYDLGPSAWTPVPRRETVPPTICAGLTPIQAALPTRYMLCLVNARGRNGAVVGSREWDGGGVGRSFHSRG